MKANELRIGNYVNEPNYDECFNTYVIKQVQTRGLSVSVLGKDIQGLYDYEDISPIPLTEEWLLKFGFLKEVDEYLHSNGQWGEKWYYVIPKFEHLLSCYKSEKEDIWFYPAKVKTGLFRIKHVHQLQNLYFALTGQELKLLKQ